MVLDSHRKFWNSSKQAAWQVKEKMWGRPAKRSGVPAGKGPSTALQVSEHLASPAGEGT